MAFYNTQHIHRSFSDFFHLRFVKPSKRLFNSNLAGSNHFLYLFKVLRLEFQVMFSLYKSYFTWKRQGFLPAETSSLGLGNTNLKLMKLQHFTGCFDQHVGFLTKYRTSGYSPNFAIVHPSIKKYIIQLNSYV